MKNTAKLAFEMLEKEMEVLSFDEAFEIMGGVGYTYAPSGDPYQDDMNAFRNQYIGGLYNSNMAITSSQTNLPPDYYLAANGAYVQNGNSDIEINRVYGITQSADSIFISPAVMSGGPNDIERMALIGHELVHAKNIQDHGTEFGNPRGSTDFRNTSEFEAYQWQANYYSANNYPEYAAQAQAMADSYSPYAIAHNWDNSFAPGYTEMPIPMTTVDPFYTTTEIIHYDRSTIK